MTDRYAECLDIAKQELTLARQLLHAEISHYPTPIAGCDAQFNHLLAQRARIQAALEALGAEYFVPTPRQPDADCKVEAR